MASETRKQNIRDKTPETENETEELKPENATPKASRRRLQDAS